MVEAGRGQLMIVKPGVVALKSSAEVAEGGSGFSKSKEMMLRDWARSDTAVYYRVLRRERMLSVHS